VTSRLPTSPDLRRWLLAWLFFTVVGSLWALATPVLGVPDEPAHTVYATAAVRGEVWEETEGPITRVTVPAGWANVDQIPACFAFQPNVTPACSPALTGEPGTAEVATSAGRYPPLYYFYTGLPTLVTEGAQAVYLMRGLTAALVGALLASGLCSLLSLRPRVLPILGFALATTPMLFFFAGAVNPQAPEIAAAICLWASGAVLLRRMVQHPVEDLGWSNPHLRRVLAATAVLTVIRPMSLLWLGLIVVILVVVFSPASVLPRLVRSRAVLTALPVLVLTTGSTLAWIVLRDALGQQDVTAFADLTAEEALIRSTAKLNDEFTQMIGHFGWLDSPAPGWAYVTYTLALGALGALALPRLSRAQRLAVGAVAVVVLVLPVAMELTSFRVSAFAWQGRYTLPLAVGVPLLLGVLPGSRRPADQRPTDEPVRTGGATAVLAIVGSVHVVSFVGALNRNVNGIDGFFVVSEPGWSPPVPAWLLILGFTAVVSAGCWSLRRLAQPEHALLTAAEAEDVAPAHPIRPDGGPGVEDADELSTSERTARERSSL
jgi:hypothetical protein